VSIRLLGGGAAAAAATTLERHPQIAVGYSVALMTTAVAAKCAATTTCNTRV
jgi:hypothetical protein